MHKEEIHTVVCKTVAAVNNLILIISFDKHYFCKICLHLLTMSTQGRPSDIY